MTVYRKHEFEAILIDDSLVVRNNRGDVKNHAHFSKVYKNNKLNLKNVRIFIDFLIKQKIPRSKYFRDACIRVTTNNEYKEKLINYIK